MSTPQLERGAEDGGVDRMGADALGRAGQHVHAALAARADEGEGEVEVLHHVGLAFQELVAHLRSRGHLGTVLGRIDVGLGGGES